MVNGPRYVCVCAKLVHDMVVSYVMTLMMDRGVFENLSSQPCAIVILHRMGITSAVRLYIARFHVLT